MIQNQPRRGGNPTVLLTVLIVVSFILMTFDIRSDGEGMAATLREELSLWQLHFKTPRARSRTRS